MTVISYFSSLTLSTVYLIDYIHYICSRISHTSSISNKRQQEKGLNNEINERYHFCLLYMLYRQVKDFGSA